MQLLGALRAGSTCWLVAFAWMFTCNQVKGEVIETWHIDNWAVSLVAGDDGGYICGAWSIIDNNDIIVLAITEHGVQMGLTNESWRLPIDRVYNVTVRIDRQYSRTLNAYVRDYTKVDIYFGFDEVFWSAYRYGQTMRVASPGFQWTISLRGTLAASELLLTCMEAYIFNDLNSTNPFEPR